MADPVGEPLHLHPLTLREKDDRYVMPAVGSKSPYYVLKSQPNAAESKRILSRALDHGVPVFVALDPGDAKRIVSVHLVVPESKLGKWPCRDAPRFTPEFWKNQNPMATMKTDRVLWIARDPGCRVHRIQLQRRDGPYYLHESQPGAPEMLRRAKESIDLDRDVRWTRCDGVFDFICALDMSMRPETPDSEVLSETDFGVVELRFGQPQSIDSGRVMLKLVKSEDYRAPDQNGAGEDEAGFVTATIAVRIGDRDLGPVVLSTTAEYGQPTSVDLPVPAPSVLRPWSEYQIALRSIDQRPPLSDPHTRSNAAVHIAVMRREKAPNAEIWGGLSRLCPADARFIEYWGTIAVAAESQGLQFKQLTLKEIGREKKAGFLVVSRKTLRLIRGFSVRLQPNSTGALEVSFFKSDANEYFFRQAGGCEFHRDLLFGPFHRSAGGFSAARN
jgi:hypothetical protein